MCRIYVQVRLRLELCCNMVGLGIELGSYFVSLGPINMRALHYQKTHVAQRPKIVAISPFSLQYARNTTIWGSLGKESGRCIQVSCNSLLHQIVFGWVNVRVLQRRSAWQYVDATTMVVALSGVRVAIVIFATT